MTLERRDFDAVVVGSGPNGLAAAITLQEAGLSVLLIEGKDQIGGGLRTAEVTLPGFQHDICSAIHPMGITSPFFQSLPLQDHGLEFIYPALAAAHPLTNGKAAWLDQSIDTTAAQFGEDRQAYLNLAGSVQRWWPLIKKDLLAPLRIPEHPVEFARFGLNALMSAKTTAARFETPAARALWAGMAAHSIQPFHKLTTSAIGLVLMAAGHDRGWPLPKGGSQQIANALASYFKALGGQIQTGLYVTSLRQLPSSHAVLFDVTPRQLLTLAGHTFSWLYRRQLERYRYGMGVFKIDWALSEPIPFTSHECHLAGTIHLGNTYEEIAEGEQLTWAGQHAARPYVLLAQQSRFDPTRAPAGKHTAWGYCHVPHGSTTDMTDVIEKQVERFAPGFRDTVLARRTWNTAQMQDHNPNYIGGDINGGVTDIGQIFTRPALRLSPYRTSQKGLYICSSSTPPGGGVHGMCGYHAASRALKDIFKLSPKDLD